MVRTFAVVLLLVAGAVVITRAQAQVMPPLAEVARQAEAAKPSVRKATKSYGNADLKADPRGGPAPAAKPPATDAIADKSSGKAVAAEAKPSGSEAKPEGEAVVKESEETWRMRATSLRKQIGEMQALIAELSLANPLRDQNPGAKAANDTQIANARTAVDGLRKQWTRLEAAAVEFKVPTVWLDPRPTFQ